MNVILSLLAVAGLFSGTVLRDPRPIEVPAGRNSGQVLEAVKSALTAQRWVVESPDGPHIIACRTMRSHMARIKVTVDTAVNITYLDSSNLDFEIDDDERTIHKTYLAWVDALSASIASTMANLCVDLSPYGTKELLGKSVADDPLMAHATREITLMSSTAQATRYQVREFSAFLSSARDPGCHPVSLVTYEDKVVSVLDVPMEQAAYTAYSHMLRFLVDSRKLTFPLAEVERQYAELQMTESLGDLRTEELLRFVEWQAQRLQDKQISRAEYDYLLAQKKSELWERRTDESVKGEQLDLMRAGQQRQQDALAIQRQQLAAQRSMAISAALANVAHAFYKPYQTYQPFRSVTCDSRPTFGGGSTMTCR